MSTTNMYKYVHGETYTASKIAQPVSGTGFVDIVGSDGVTPIAYTAIALFDDAIGTTELVIDVDFEVGSADARYTALEASTVYRQVRILNATYQSAVFYADFSAVGGYVTRETFLDGDNTYTGDNTYSGSAIFSGNVRVTGSAVFSGFSPQTASAWVTFDGTTNTGGLCTMADSYNVDSVTDGGTGKYSVNIDADLSDANYAICGSGYSSGNNVMVVGLGTSANTASIAYIQTGPKDSAGNADCSYISVVIFGGV